MSLSHLELNPNFTPFCDKEGDYVEVIALLKNKAVLLYANDNTEATPEIPSSVKLFIGDKLYFTDNGKFKELVSSQIVAPTTAATSSRQSPSHSYQDPKQRL